MNLVNFFQYEREQGLFEKKKKRPLCFQRNANNWEAPIVQDKLSMQSAGEGTDSRMGKRLKKLVKKKTDRFSSAGKGGQSNG